MCSNEEASSPAPLPRAIARSMLSFGIDAWRAFSIAFRSARFASGSGPPSRAATMIARASFEKSWPRRLSVTPFACLIEAHLLCPDIRRLPDRSEEELVHARIFRQLGVERGDEDVAVPQEHRLAVELGEDLDLRPELADARRADEDAAQRLVLACEVEVGLEARDLAAERVPVDGHVDQPEMRAVEQDHPRARAEDRPLEAADRLLEPVEPDQAPDGRRLAAR